MGLYHVMLQGTIRVMRRVPVRAGSYAEAEQKAVHTGATSEWEVSPLVAVGPSRIDQIDVLDVQVSNVSAVKPSDPEMAAWVEQEEPAVCGSPS